ncbi:MAG: NUDIX hydrolase [Candidatus Levybacteria bacterium]|nr:NUDIX hydrolase [Candidatus Levybacteria bacterium]
MSNSWKRIGRKTSYSSPFVTVFEDEIELPNGKTIPDYTVVQKPDFVMIVATDKANNVLLIHEYKYAVNETLLTLPAGHIEKNEDPASTAKRELLEETGYTATAYDYLGALYDYPSKDSHQAHIVRARDIQKTKDQTLEDTESIESQFMTVLEIKQKILQGEIKASAVIASLAKAGLLF